MSRSNVLLRTVRTIHLYLGVFIAPALLFFAFTGAIQTFSLHESSRESSYQPPKWILGLAQLHKKQTAALPPRRPRPNQGDGGEGPRPRPAGPGSPEAGAPQGSKAPDTAGPKPPGHLPMKIFFLLVAVGLCVSTLTGIYMAYRYTRGAWTISGLLAAGVVLPLLLLPF